MVDINMIEGGLLMPPISESGSLVSFNAPVPLDISTLKVAIAPVQSGSGDPNPTDNIRPITGWTGANVYVSPTADIADATIYPVSWSDSAGTVYGGTLDVLTGKLTVTHRMKTVGEMSWSAHATYANLFLASNATGKLAGYMNLQAEQYTPTNAGLSAMPDYSIRGHATNAGAIYIKDSRYSTADAFVSAQSAMKIVYELATPLEYTLSATDIQTLIGQNNIWADCGDITLKTSLVFGKIKIRLMEEGISINGTSPLLRSSSSPEPDTLTEKEIIGDIVKEPVDEKDTVKELPDTEDETEPEEEEPEDDNEG